MRIVDPGKSTSDVVTVAALASMPIMVNHGSTASTARPVTPQPVIWVGTVDPTNAVVGDYYMSVAAAAASFTGALDGLATPFRAHSLRRLLSSYTGPLIKVRRDSDNTEQTIGYTSAGDLDTAALLAFAGSGSAFVSVWYDQSGSARDVTQTTVASQPRIVNAGTTDTLGSKPACVFDGTDDYLSSTVTGLYAAGAATVAAVLSGASTANSTTISESNASNASATYRMIRSSSANWNVQLTNDAGTSVYANSAASSNLFDGAAHQAFYLDTGAAISTWKDAAAVHSALTATRSGALTPSRFALGASVQTSIANYLNGKMQEVIAWGSDQSSQRTALSTGQKAYWGTP